MPTYFVSAASPSSETSRTQQDIAMMAATRTAVTVLSMLYLRAPPPGLFQVREPHSVMVNADVRYLSISERDVQNMMHSA